MLVTAFYATPDNLLIPKMERTQGNFFVSALVMTIVLWTLLVLARSSPVSWAYIVTHLLSLHEWCRRTLRKPTAGRSAGAQRRTTTEETSVEETPSEKIDTMPLEGIYTVPNVGVRPLPTPPASPKRTQIYPNTEVNPVDEWPWNIFASVPKGSDVQSLSWTTSNSTRRDTIRKTI